MPIAGGLLNIPYQDRDPKLPAAAHIGGSISQQIGGASAFVTAAEEKFV